MSASLWSNVLDRIRDQVNSYSFNTWFQPTRMVAASSRTLTVQVPNPLFAEWLNKNYLPLISQIVQDIQGESWEVVFTCGAAQGAAAKEANGRGGTASPVHSYAPAAALPAPAPPAPTGPALNPRYTFDSFVEGSANQFAYAAARAVADRPAGAYNPLYIYGGTGLGKTHLMHAIGHQLLRCDAGIRLVYTTMEAFMNELISAIRYEKTMPFKERFRTVDVLLVDDLQFLAGKERTQEEFFHTFNALYEGGKQIVLTSDCAPRDIPSIEERLCSRFEWGLIADIQPPDLETKVAILNKKAEREGLHLPPDVALFIAGSVKSNVRELEGCLIRVTAFASIRRQALTVELAKSILEPLRPPEKAHVTVDAILKRVSEEFNLTVAEMKSKSNSRSIAYPRQIAMYLCKTLTERSLPEIGKIFGGKHHTTVLHAVRKIEAARKEDRELDRILGVVTRALR